MIDIIFNSGYSEDMLKIFLINNNNCIRLLGVI